MKEKCRTSKRWVVKALICLAFIGFLATKCEAQLGTPPIIAVQPLGLSVQNGGTAIITTTAVSLTSMEFTWCLNGHEIKNPKVVNVVVPLVGTVSTLTVPNVSSTNQGSYTVKIENGVGEVTSKSADLIVLGNVISTTLNILTTGTGMTTNGFHLNLSGPAGSNYVIEATSDLQHWTPICTNNSPTGSISYTDTAATNLAFRYYRAKLQ
jgi:hypothetical protein